MHKLSENQRAMLGCSAVEAPPGSSWSVRLQGAGNWRTARSLVEKKLGRIEYGRLAGGGEVGLFYANGAGIAAVAIERDADRGG
ncbi:hypothetical protein [Novosphingobium aquimarinum]|uniref:hypothetical protein n=1 Tax=Novosphingobium aquimarinum TaxID=2682494 RepID=UPI0012EC190D|nr:hypothetical protein [Novosphingobium aquimarinum]